MSRPKRRTIHFSWLQTLGAMIDGDAKVQVWCDACKASRRFTREDLVALAERKGRDYSLINRRCRCRLTPGCKGWNKFDYLLGVYRPLADTDTHDRWNMERPRGRIPQDE